MPTSCQIGTYRHVSDKLEDYKTLIYRHSHGLPADVIRDIMPFLIDYKKMMGLDEPEYVGARLLQFLCNKMDAEIDEMSDKPSIYKYLGYAIAHHFSPRMEYLYKICPNVMLVYHVVDGEFKIIDEIKI